MKVTCEIHVKGHRVYTFRAKGGGIWNQLTFTEAIRTLANERDIPEHKARQALVDAQQAMEVRLKSAPCPSCGSTKGLHTAQCTA